MTAVADWYPDPHAPGTEVLRYWDGTAWTDHTHDPSQPPAEATNSDTGEDQGVEADEVDEAAAEHAPVAAERVPELPESEEAVDRAVVAQERSTPIARTSPDRKIPTFGAKKFAEDLISENEGLIAEINHLQTVIARFGIEDVVERASALASLESNIEAQSARLQLLTKQVADTESQLVAARDTLTVQNVGLFDYTHPAETSAELATELEVLRYEIKTMNKVGSAVKATVDLTFGDSAAKGKMFTTDMSRILLRAYNAEAENCIKGVKAGNLAAAQSRLTKTADAIAKQGAMIELRVEPAYHRLRLKELELASRHMIRLADEREAERERKAELREQNRAEAELRGEGTAQQGAHPLPQLHCGPRREGRR